MKKKREKTTAYNKYNIQQKWQHKGVGKNLNRGRVLVHYSNLVGIKSNYCYEPKGLNGILGITTHKIPKKKNPLKKNEKEIRVVHCKTSIK